MFLPQPEVTGAGFDSFHSTGLLVVGQSLDVNTLPLTVNTAVVLSTAGGQQVEPIQPGCVDESLDDLSPELTELATRDDAYTRAIKQTNNDAGHLLGKASFRGGQRVV